MTPQGFVWKLEPWELPSLFSWGEKATWEKKISIGHFTSALENSVDRGRQQNPPTFPGTSLDPSISASLAPSHPQHKQVKVPQALERSAATAGLLAPPYLHSHHLLQPLPRCPPVPPPPPPHQDPPCWQTMTVGAAVTSNTVETPSPLPPHPLRRFHLPE